MSFKISRTNDVDIVVVDIADTVSDTVGIIIGIGTTDSIINTDVEKKQNNNKSQ